LLAFVTLALAGHASSWRIHRAEWLFFGAQQVKPDVRIHKDSRRAPRAPELAGADQIPGQYSFAGRSAYIGWGGGASATSARASPGQAPAYWRSDRRSEWIAPPGIPLVCHSIRERWDPPATRQALAGVFCFGLLPILLLFNNTCVLPPVLLWTNASQSTCSRSLRSFLWQATRISCVCQVPLGIILLFMALNPSRLWISHSAWARPTGATVLLALYFLPLLLTLYQVRRRAARHLFGSPTAALLTVVILHCVVVVMPPLLSGLGAIL